MFNNVFVDPVRLGEYFEEYLKFHDLVPNTISDCEAVLNKLEELVGRSLFAEHNLATLNEWVKEFSAGGARAEQGKQQSGAVLAVLGHWKSFCESWQQGFAVGYGNALTERLLAGRTVQQRVWLWQVLEFFQKQYPQADHWMTGGKSSKLYIRIGVRNAANRNGNPLFFVEVLDRQFYLVAGQNGRLFDEQEYFWSAKSTQHPTRKAVAEWLSKTLEKYPIAEIAGSGNKPANYTQDSVELEFSSSENNHKKELPMINPSPALNQILFGPPGTGKTYHTINHALKVLAPELFDKNGNELVARERLKEAFDQFVKEGRIAFVTFHQSFSYEDFVEGLRAVTDSDDESETSRGVHYEVAAGVFLQLCEKARSNPVQNADLGISEHARVWKIAIGEANGEQQTRQYCFEHNQARIGWDNVGDLRADKLNNPEFNLGSNEKSSLRQFSKDMQIGDIVLCFKSVSSICAVGVVSGEYFFEESTPSVVRPDYKNVLPVRWLAKNIDFNILPLNNNVRLTMKTVYPLPRITWPKLNAALADANIALGGQVQLDNGGQDCVLIIDEINRGNISRIFGELISLIEPSKRQGAAEALSVTLPYSKEKFSVPNNLYIIGTMNTADRSLTGIDIALRRRFEFIEMPPKPELLTGVMVDGINIEQLLNVLNDRIEALIGRDYCLGHAYFMPLKTDRRLVKLAQIFQKQILPLLQEYFFDDWQRIAWVFNDHRKSEELRFLQQQGSSAEQLFGHVEGLGELAPRWRINHAAFNKIESYRALIGQPLKSNAATEPAASIQPAPAPNATTATQQPAAEPEAVAGAEGAM